MDDESYSPGDGSGLHWESTEDSGSNLVDPRLQRRLTQEPVLLDLPREPIDDVVFDTYTDTGTLVKKPSCFQSYGFFFFCSFQSLPICWSLFPPWQDFPPLSSASDPSALSPGADTC